MSSVSFDRDQLVREMRASVVTMVVAVALYGAFFLWIPAKKAGFPVTVHWGLLAVALVLLVIGAWMWQTTPTPKMMELASRKLGKAEREPGWPPRAMALRTRIRVVTMFLEFGGLIGVLSVGLHGPLVAAALAIALGVLALGWVYVTMPEKARRVLG